MKVELVSKTVPVVEGVSTADFAAYVARIGETKMKKFLTIGKNNYFVSNFGGVVRVTDKGVKGLDVKVLTTYTDKDGYKYVTVYNKGYRKNYKVHRLVAYAFLGLKDTQHVNHKDGNKANNEASNLEACNQSENMKHAVRTGLLTNCTKRGENHNTSKYSFADVCEIRRLYKQTKISMRGLAKQFNCSSGYISDVVNMKIRVEE